MRGNPLLDDHFLEFFLFAQVSEDHVDFTDHQLEHVQFGLQQVKNSRFNGSGGYQVEYIYITPLSNPAEAADALLDLHRIPWKIEVTQSMGELEISPFTAGLGAQ